jgi:hypothetical protein
LTETVPLRYRCIQLGGTLLSQVIVPVEGATGGVVCREYSLPGFTLFEIAPAHSVELRAMLPKKTALLFYGGIRSRLKKCLEGVLQPWANTSSRLVEDG